MKVFQGAWISTILFVMLISGCGIDPTKRVDGTSHSPNPSTNKNTASKTNLQPDMHSSNSGKGDDSKNTIQDPTIQMLDAKNGWAWAMQGGTPILLRTTKAAKTWEAVSLPSGVGKQSIVCDALNANTVWVMDRLKEGDVVY